MVRLATGSVSLVVGWIEALGLRVALYKDEGLFHGPCLGRPPRLYHGYLGPRTGSGSDELFGPDLQRQVALPTASFKADRRCPCPWATLVQFGWSQRHDKTALHGRGLSGQWHYMVHQCEYRL